MPMPYLDHDCKQHDGAENALATGSDGSDDDHDAAGMTRETGKLKKTGMTSTGASKIVLMGKK